MTEQEINVEIALCCGWKWYRIPHSEKQSQGPIKTLFLPTVHEVDQDPIWLQPGEPTDRIANWEYMKSDGFVPDYCHDLNAMYGVEDFLSCTGSGPGICTYAMWLVRIQDRTKVQGDWWTYIHATAMQRAEAFLRTNGLWKDL